MRAEEGTWPLLDDPSDPWAEAWPEDDHGYADLCSLTEHPPPQGEYTSAARALQRYLSDVWAGRSTLDPGSLAALARQAHIEIEPTRPDRRPAVRAPYRATEEDVCRIALDIDPACGLFGPDAALGLWAMSADATSTADRRTLTYALAQWAAGRPTPHPPLKVWSRSNEAPPPRDRLAVLAIRRAPMSLWEISGPTIEGRWHLQDLFGLEPHRLPQRALDLDHAAGFARLQQGAQVLARIVLHEDDEEIAFAPLVLPRPVSRERAHETVLLQLIAQRLRSRRSTRTDVLRDRAAAVCRGLHHLCLAP
jgi:hypothetical protein